MSIDTGIPDGVNALEYLRQKQKERQARVVGIKQNPIVRNNDAWNDLPTYKPRVIPTRDEVAEEVKIARRLKELKRRAKVEAKKAKIARPLAPKPEIKFYTAARSSKITLSAIIDFVCTHYDIAQSEILSPSRKKPICLARHVIMLLARELTTLSTPKIGGFMGRDHTTILINITRLKESCLKNEALALEIRSIVSSLREKYL